MDFGMDIAVVVTPVEGMAMVVDMDTGMDLVIVVMGVVTDGQILRYDYM